jgi:2-octaprenylphenol hydroxylase
LISTDITIIGGGCVGLTAALGLADNGFNVIVVDAATSHTELTEPELRVSAISAASENIFRQLGSWSHLDSTRFAPYNQMSVWDKDSFGKIEFAAEQLSESRLGHIIENNNIRNSLIAVASSHANIQLKFDSRVTSLHNQSNNQSQQVLITLEDGTPIISKLLVAADGANSWVRKQLKTPMIFSDYDHHALVATIKTTEPHQACARQVFLKSGPLALLPLKNENQCSIVWSSSPEHVQQLKDMTEQEFNKSITAATDSVLGPITLTSQRVSYPLTMRYAKQWVNQGVVFMGDAAHTIHPLAGLGRNLGLLDAASLVQMLSSPDLLNTNKTAELTKQLRKYEGWRKAEAQTYIAAMAGLKALFEGDNKFKKLIRGVGLLVTNKAPMIKYKLIQQAMGITGDLPDLAKVKDNI